MWQPCELLYTCYLVTYSLQRYHNNNGLFRVAAYKLDQYRSTFLHVADTHKKILEKIGRVHVVPKISSRTDRQTDTIATIFRHAYRGGVKSFSELNRRRRCRIRSDDGSITQILHPCYRIVLRTAVYYKSVISLVPRLSNMTLPAFAAERRATAPLLVYVALQPAAVDRYHLPARRSAANPPHAAAVAQDGSDRKTDGHRTVSQTLLRIRCGQCQ